MFQKILVDQLDFEKIVPPLKISIFFKRDKLFFVIQLEITDLSPKKGAKLYYHIPAYCYCIQFEQCKDLVNRRYNIAGFVKQIQQNWQQLFSFDSLPLLRIEEECIEPYAAAFYNREELRVDAEIAFRIINFIRHYKSSEENSRTLGEEVIDYIRSLPIDPRFESRKQAFTSMFSLKEKGKVSFNRNVFLNRIIFHAEVEGFIVYFPTQTTVDIFQAILSLKERQTNIFGAAQSGKSLSICLLHQLCDFIEAYRENIYRDKQHQYTDSLLQQMAAIPKLFYFPHDKLSNFTFFKETIIHQMPYQLKTLHSHPENYLKQLKQFYKQNSINVIFLIDNSHPREYKIPGLSFVQGIQQDYEQVQGALKKILQLPACYITKEKIKVTQYPKLYSQTIAPTLQQYIQLTREKRKTVGEMRRIVQFIEYQHIKTIKKRQKDQVARQKLMEIVSSEYQSFFMIKGQAHVCQYFGFFFSKPYTLFRNFFKWKHPYAQTILDQSSSRQASDIMAGFTTFFEKIRFYSLNLQIEQNPLYSRQIRILEETFSTVGIAAYWK